MKRCVLKVLQALPLMLLAAGADLQAAIVDATWTGASGGSWFTAGNWDTGIVPNNVTDLYNVTHAPSSGTSIIVLDGSALIGNLTLGIPIVPVFPPVIPPPPPIVARLDGETTTPRALSVLGTFTWNSGNLGGAGNLQVNANGGGTINATMPNSVTLGGSGSILMLIEGASTFTHAGSGGIQFGPTMFPAGNSQLAILPGSTWVNSGGGSMTVGAGSGSIMNAGTFRKSTSAGVVQVSPFFNNMGTLDVEMGTLQLSSFMQSGANSVVDLDGGSLAAVSAQINGGRVIGSGSFTTFAPNSFTLGAATLAPGHGAGTLTLSSLSAGISSAFEMELGGLFPASTPPPEGGDPLPERPGGDPRPPPPGGEPPPPPPVGGSSPGYYDQIIVTGAAVLNGTLDVSFINGFENTISTGNTFALLTAGGGLSGTFDGLPDGGTLNVDGILFTADYTANAFILTAVPEPETYACVVGLGLVVFAFARRGCVRKPARQGSAM